MASGPVVRAVPPVRCWPPLSTRSVGVLRLSEESMSSNGRPVDELRSAKPTGGLLSSGGALVALAGAVALILGSAPGHAWAQSYYAAIGSSAVAADMGWQELVPAALPLAAASGAALLTAAAVALIALRYWPLAAPWRIAPRRRLRWLPGAPILLVGTLGPFLFIRYSLLPDEPGLLAQVLSLTFVFVAFTSALFAVVWVAAGSFVTPFGDPLVETVRSIPSDLTKVESKLARAASSVLAGGQSRRRAGAIALFTALAAGCLCLAAAASQGFYFWPLWATAGPIFMLWSARLVWDVTRHDHAVLDRRNQRGVALGDIRESVLDAGEKYAIVKTAMVERVDQAIIKYGVGHRVEPRRVRWDFGSRLLVVIAVLVALCLVQLIAPVLGVLQGEELRENISRLGESACETREDFQPFAPLAVGAAEAAWITTRSSVSEMETTCVWVLRRSESVMWVAEPSSSGTTDAGLQIRAVHLDDLVSISTPSVDPPPTED